MPARGAGCAALRAAAALAQPQAAAAAEGRAAAHDGQALTAQHRLDFVLEKGLQRLQGEDGAEALAEGGHLEHRV